MMAAMSLRRDEAAEEVPPGAPTSTYAADHRVALSDLYRSDYRRLVRLAAILLDRREEAEEVVQEAFIRLDRHWDRVDDEARRPAYLRSIVMNLARSKMRRRLVARRRRPLPDAEPAEADERAVLAAEHAEVVAALRLLPARQQQVLVLRYYEDLSETEIADTLGISNGAVKSHAHRGIAALTEALGGLR
jgi:RNA polymerase sigma-70 factor (sigma-E family)